VKKPNRIRPVECVWNGDHFIPLPRFKRLCDQQFVVHETYAIIPSEERSMTSHRGYFAQIHEAWKNLAEEFDGKFPSSEALRAWALVQTGYATEANYVMDSENDAKQLAVTLRRLSPLAVIRVSGNVVQHFEAESQSVRSMKKERFAESCKAVLELVSSMARTTPSELRKNAGRAA
jgi:hypothetical protein